MVGFTVFVARHLRHRPIRHVSAVMAPESGTAEPSTVKLSPEALSPAALSAAESVSAATVPIHDPAGFAEVSRPAPRSVLGSMSATGQDALTCPFPPVEVGLSDRSDRPAVVVGAVPRSPGPR